MVCAQTSSQSITDNNKSRDGEGGVGVGLTAGKCSGKFLNSLNLQLLNLNTEAINNLIILRL